MAPGIGSSLEKHHTYVVMTQEMLKASMLHTPLLLAPIEVHKVLFIGSK
jgi:hypothetical protein